MSPTVFGYVVLFTLLLGGAAAAIEWGLQGRVGARHAWTVAIALALALPATAVTWHTISVRTAPPVPMLMQSQLTQSPIAITTPIEADARTISWRRILESVGAPLIGASAIFAGLAGWSARTMNILLAVWIGLSVALLMWLTIGVLRWRAARLEWDRITLDGIDVDVSPSTGPAVFGFLSHRIVLPAWATRMEPEHRRLILAHEQEHIDAHDPERLAVAIGAIVLMPWNVGLWMCAARLRRAIELDCDARVLKRFPGAKEYGYVLLRVAARGRSTGALAIPMVGLLRLPSKLEQRLKAMTRKRTPGYRSAIGGGLAALVAVSVAFTTPVPVAQVPEYIHAVPAASNSRLPIVASSPAQALDTVPKGSKKRDQLTARQRDSVRVLKREVTARRIAVTAAQARLEAAQVELNKRRLELNAEKGRAKALERNAPADPHSTYFPYEVSRPVGFMRNSPWPVYPDAMRKQHVNGEVDAEFVVDTSGRVIPGTASVTKATNPLFKKAVLEALPNMRFMPAEIHGIRVKQLVQQPFTFVIAK